MFFNIINVLTFTFDQFLRFFHLLKEKLYWPLVEYIVMTWQSALAAGCIMGNYLLRVDLCVVLLQQDL